MWFRSYWSNMIQFLTRLDHVLPIDHMCIEHLCIYTYENWVVTRIERVKAPQMCHLRRSRRRIAAGEVMGGLVWERPRILVRRWVGRPRARLLQGPASRERRAPNIRHFHHHVHQHHFSVIIIIIIIVTIIVTISIIIILHDYQVINRHADHQHYDRPD